MSIVVATARKSDGKAVHMFAVAELEKGPICGRLKGGITADQVAFVDDDTTCAACRSAYKKGDFTLDLGDVATEEDTADSLEDQDGEMPTDEGDGDLDEDEDLEGAEDDEDEEDERSTSKAQKFAAFAASHGWSTRVFVGTTPAVQGDVTFVIAESGNVRIKMAWQEGRYQYEASRIIKGQGEVLNALIRNASAARGYVNAISIQEDATKPVLLRRVK